MRNKRDGASSGCVIGCFPFRDGRNSTTISLWLGGRMNLHTNKLSLSLLVVTVLITSAFAQKISVGYDKGVDFSRYTNYTWTEPGSQPTRPLLYAAMVGSID